ncbi:MAG: invasion associated locus B family protein [Nitratireductor sp.]|nr:invasion associated locus B family protein [Nitratireductor sp.]
MNSAQKLPSTTISRFFAIAGGVALTVAATLPLAAGPAQAQAQRPDGWFKVCAKQENNDICNTQIQSVASTGQVLTAISLIDVKGEVTRRVFQITVPTGRLIPAGIKLRVDDKQETTLPYLYCFPQSCIAEVKLDDALVTVLKGGGKLTVTSLNVQQKENPIEVTLSGFTAAYDGPPLSQGDVEQRQRQLQEELRKKAEEARKKLQDAQDQAKGSGSQ